MKEQKPKKRIVSTVILGLILIVGIYFTILLLPVTWAAIKEASENADTGNSVVAGTAVAFALSLGIVLAFIVYIGVLVIGIPCLLFSIRNRKSSLKPIRIISYVYDGLYGAILLISIVKMILLLIGV